MWNAELREDTQGNRYSFLFNFRHFRSLLLDNVDEQP